MRAESVGERQYFLNRSLSTFADNIGRAEFFCQIDSICVSIQKDNLLCAKPFRSDDSA